MWKVEGVLVDGIKLMMMGKVDGVGGMVFSVRIWCDWVGLVVMFMDFCEFGVVEFVLDVCENVGFIVNNLEIWKCKM